MAKQRTSIVGDKAFAMQDIFGKIDFFTKAEIESAMMRIYIVILILS